MLSWVLRHRHQLRALYGLPPEPALAALIALEAERSEPSAGGETDAVAAPRRRSLPQVVLTPERPRR